MSARVAIAGVGMHPYGRFDDRTLTDLGTHAVTAALRESGVDDRSQIHATFCGTAYGGVATAHKILGALGMTGGPIVDMEAGCASGAAALMLAAGAIRAGQYDTVLVLGVEKMPKGMIRSSFFEPWQEEAGFTPAPAYFALRAQRLMRESGVTRDDLAAVVVKNRGNGAHNPNAMFRKPVDAEGVLASKLVCEPLRLWMLCSPNEGAAAVVLRATSGARPPDEVELVTSVLRSHVPGDVLGESTPMAGLVDDVGVPSPTQLAADAAYEEAGLGPDDLDLAELQDTDAARELLAYEELGFCGRGESADWFRAGRSQPNGALPVNTSGGLLSKGEPLGASAVGHVVELTWQLRGAGAGRRVDGARVGLAHNVGRGANASVTILRR